MRKSIMVMCARLPGVVRVSPDTAHHATEGLLPSKREKL
jgi:hypothetical protein